MQNDTQNDTQYDARLVVLVPGFHDDTRKVAYLARRLRGAGLMPWTISPQPSSGEVKLESLAQQLATAIDTQLEKDEPIGLFGFSMGGLIARYYVQNLDAQNLGGTQRVRRLVTLACPNRGSWSARLYPHRHACRQMVPGSPFLAALNRDLTPLARVNYVSIWSPLDLTILPATSSRLPVGKSIAVYSPIHGWHLRNPRVVDRVVDAFVRDIGPPEKPTKLHAQPHPGTV